MSTNDTYATTIASNMMRVDAWTRLGEDVSAAMTAKEALDAANLANWNVRKTPLTTVDDVTGATLAVPDRWATLRTDPRTNTAHYQGVVGGTYHIFQNEEHVGLLDAIVGESGAHFDTAGTLRGGRDVFVSMKMPDSLVFGNGDMHDLNLVALNSHDGSSALRFIVTPVRIECSNMVRAAIRDAVSSFSVRHVKGGKAIIAEARQALDLTFAYTEALQNEVEQMMSWGNVSDKTFTKIAARLFDLDIATTKRQKSTAERHVAGALDLWKNSPTLDKIKGTRWAGYNAITEYADHFMSARSVGGRDEQDVRAQRAVVGAPVLRLKEAAFATFNRAVLA